MYFPDLCCGLITLLPHTERSAVLTTTACRAASDPP